jgi:hemoglobin-like flavoprotein
MKHSDSPIKYRTIVIRKKPIEWIASETNITAEDIKNIKGSWQFILDKKESYDTREYHKKNDKKKLVRYNTIRTTLIVDFFDKFFNSWSDIAPTKSRQFSFIGKRSKFLGGIINFIIENCHMLNDENIRPKVRTLLNLHSEYSFDIDDYNNIITSFFTTFKDVFYGSDDYNDLEYSWRKAFTILVNLLEQC